MIEKLGKTLKELTSNMIPWKIDVDCSRRLMMVATTNNKLASRNGILTHSCNI